MKKYIKLMCAAKINLIVDVIGKRPNGYHNLQNIFQSVNLYDTLEISVEDGNGISLSCDTDDIPCNEDNLAWKAAKAMLEISHKNVRIHINLFKNIPSSAGMGGGSADAAGVLYGLNKLLECDFSVKQLQEIGLKIGADIPCMLCGGTAYVEGIGEIITPLEPIDSLNLIIVKGISGISTPIAYQAIDTLINPVHPNTTVALQAIKNHDVELLKSTCDNLFEEVTTIEDVFRAKRRLLECGAERSIMCGTGSAVFGIFSTKTSKETLTTIADTLSREFKFVKVAKPTQKNIIITEYYF